MKSSYKKSDICISYSLVIIWMILIFFFSNANGDISGSSSTGLISKSITLIDNTLVKLNIKKNYITKEDKLILVDKLNYPVRKMAHFTEYLILCYLWLNALKKSNVKHKYIYAIVISVLYACSDEYHQTFIADRSGQFLDVLIDSMGILTGGGLYKLVEMRKKD